MKNANPALQYYYDNKEMVLAKRKLRYAISKWIDANVAYADNLDTKEIEKLRKQLIRRMFDDNCAKFKTADSLRVRATELLHQTKGDGPKVLHVDKALETEPKKQMKRSRHEKRLDYYQSKRAEFVAYSKAYTAAQKWVKDNMPDAPAEERKKALREVTKTLIPQFYTEDIRPYNPQKNCRKRKPEKATKPVKDVVEEVVVQDKELVSATTSIESPVTTITVAGDIKIDPTINVSLPPDTRLDARPGKLTPVEVVVAFKDPFFITFIMSLILTCAILIAMFVK
jgi:hypothetical protein